MKIDNYIRHLELQRKGLNERKTNLLRDSDKQVMKKGYDPNYIQITETGNKIRETSNKIKFLTELRKELINNEVHNKKTK